MYFSSICNHKKTNYNKLAIPTYKSITMKCTIVKKFLWTPDSENKLPTNIASPGTMTIKITVIAIVPKASEKITIILIYSAKKKIHNFDILSLKQPDGFQNRFLTNK